MFTGLQFLQLHLGQVMGTEAEVAFSSMSGALKVCPHLGHLNVIIPRIIIVLHYLVIR